MTNPYGQNVLFPITFATNAKSSTTVYIGGARDIALEIVTFGNNLVTSTANIFVQAANSSGGTYRRVQVLQATTATTGQIYDWEIPSTTGNRIIRCDALVGFEYALVELSKTATAGLTGCQVHVMR